MLPPPPVAETEDDTLGAETVMDSPLIDKDDMVTERYNLREDNVSSDQDTYSDQEQEDYILNEMVHDTVEFMLDTFHNEDITQLNANPALVPSSMSIDVDSINIANPIKAAMNTYNEQSSSNASSLKTPPDLLPDDQVIEHVGNKRSSRSSRTRIKNDQDNIPSGWRGCPKCQTMDLHQDACKTVKCRFCHTRFCVFCKTLCVGIEPRVRCGCPDYNGPEEREKCQADQDSRNRKARENPISLLD